MVTLLVHGVVHQTGDVGTARTAGSADAVPSKIRKGGPVIDAGKEARGVWPAQRTISLTFDDGPDPRWTPKILAALAEYRLPATFFVTGARAADHPDLIRQERAAGHEIGVHTFTHADLTQASRWRESIELRQTQNMLAGSAGITSSLLRLPYNVDVGNIDNAAWRAMRNARRSGYLTVFATSDSDDWRPTSTDHIVNKVFEDALKADEAGHGSIVLFHDAGGNRERTVAALRRLIPILQEQGFRFTTVSQAVGMPSANASATTSERWQGAFMVWLVTVSDAVVAVLWWAFAVAGLSTLLRLIVLAIAAYRHKHQRRRTAHPPVSLPVSIVVPAHNEALGIEATLRSLVASRYPRFEIIVVDDGSTDKTHRIAVDLVRREDWRDVTVVRQANAGKPAALNTGIAHAKYDLLVLMDGDTVFESDTVRRLVRPFADPSVGAVSGNAKVGNRDGLLGRWQHIEYVVGFNLDRRLFDIAQCMPTVPGAIGAFRREALERVGGFSADTLAEDTDVTMALCRDGWRVTYSETARAWTEAPASLGQLWRQRHRWCYGTLQAMWKHRAALRQSGSAGKLGRRGLLYLLMFQVLLPMLAPVVDLFAVYTLLFERQPSHLLMVCLGFLGAQLVAAIYAFRLDGESLKPLWTLPLQQFVYRQLMYLVVIQSVFTAVAGMRLRWQRLDRRGGLRVPDDPAGASDALAVTGGVSTSRGV